MQDAREPMIARLGAADVDDGSILEIASENIECPAAHIFFEGFEHLVDQYPARGMQQEPRKYQALLLVVTQFAVPAPRVREHGNQASQTEALECIPECLG